MKKICLTCKYSSDFRGGLLCFIDSRIASPIAVEAEYLCENYKKISNSKLFKRISEMYNIESHNYNEEDDYIYSVDFDKDEGFCISTPIVVNGVRKNKKSNIYLDEQDARFLVGKLNFLLEV